MPYGVSDVTTIDVLVSIGTHHDTTDSLSWASGAGGWWRLIADSGGSNGHRLRLFKAELQVFPSKTGLEIQVSHFPLGTRKGNAIEREWLSAISINRLNRPLESFETVVRCIAPTQTRRGGQVRAEWDEDSYEKGHQVDDATFQVLNIARQPGHGEWNEIVEPQSQT